MAQTVKTISLLFSEDYIQLTEQGDGTVKVDFTNEFYDRFFDDGIFSKISEDCLFVYYGEEGSDGVEPYLIWGECQVPIEDDEEYESFSLEATEKLIADNILLSPQDVVFPKGVVGGGIELPNLYERRNYPTTKPYYQETVKVLMPDTKWEDKGMIKALVFHLCPFRYDAAEKKLYLLTDIKLNITLKSEKNPISPYDLDGDGKLTLNDITMLINIYLEKSE